MVQICKLNTKIELKPLAENLNINDNILYIEHGSTINKGINNKKISKKKSENRNYFYNQVTLHIYNDLKQNKRVNVKIFNNGKLQMTGISKPEDGKKAVDYICNMINKLSDNNITIITNKENYKVFRYSYKTVMINTCYEVGVCINREVLYNILSKRYKLNTIYDADGYPGVRVEYYYNTLTTTTQFEGICKCSEKCRGKGVGEGDNNCRKISIAIFQSGSTIIAGGCNTIGPINKTYEFINNIIKTILGEVRKNDTDANRLKKERATKVFIDKQAIINNEYFDKILEF
jgi:hypothetical protein